MLNPILAVVLLFGYIKTIQKNTETMICIIAACTALVNTVVQGYLPGGSGVGVSVIITTIATVILVKGQTKL